ncbi:patatin-like phospholipase family protein [Candidatus Desulforudis audaxviator]|uniref:Patatin n=1 Tax=Desulforudis audaxviator (strain MP104C) TaxID=477974 RepID=B1I5C7_DESAP|nr:patatin-like phospholipase family protein [Candidatus Desulforudis audaxviator]ACA60224.1 Patatin [Candidatus Desulforudis audaxviator MP104C]AZK60273.1 phospholipase [Candidatus Desulforudis audaxviator]
MEERRTVEERPRIGLALGGGGARGYAHLGVLKAFREANIPIDVIAGTSMGAVVGAAYASGYRIDELIDMALQIRWRRLVSLADPTIPRQGVIAGNRLEKYFDALTMGREFNQLEKTLIVVAADIATGEEVRINSGPVARALRASTAVPGIFCPVKSGRRILVDGSVTSPVPLAAAAEAGAAVVVAVDVCSPVDRTDVLVQAWKCWKEMPSKKAYRLTGAPGFWRFLKPVLPESVNIVSRSLDLYDRYVNTSPRVTPSVRRWLLRPAVEDVRWYEFHRVRECIQAGEAVGRQAADQIKALLKTEDLAGGAGH